MHILLRASIRHPRIVVVLDLGPEHINQGDRCDQQAGHGLRHEREVPGPAQHPLHPQ